METNQIKGILRPAKTQNQTNPIRNPKTTNPIALKKQTTSRNKIRVANRTTAKRRIIHKIRDPGKANLAPAAEPRIQTIQAKGTPQETRLTAARARARNRNRLPAQVTQKAMTNQTPIRTTCPVRTRPDPRANQRGLSREMGNSHQRMTRRIGATQRMTPIGSIELMT